MIYLAGLILAFLVTYLLRKDNSKTGKEMSEKNPSTINDHMFPNAPENIRKWISFSVEASNLYGIPIEIILGQIWTESSGNAHAVGSAGEIGLMQLKQIAVKDIKENGYNSYSGWKQNPKENILAGTAYLHLQKKRCKGNITCALGSYNQGYNGAKVNQALAAEYAEKVLNRAKFLGY